MRLNIDTSTIVINGQSFPAVGLLCTPSRDNHDDYDRLICELKVYRFGVYVPLENGALVEVNMNEWIDAQIVSTAQELYESLHQDDTALYLPISMKTEGRRIVRGRDHRSVVQEDWLAEWITRLSKRPCDQVTGPRAEMVSLRQADKIMRDRTAATKEHTP